MQTTSTSALVAEKPAPEYTQEHQTESLKDILSRMSDPGQSIDDKELAQVVQSAEYWYRVATTIENNAPSTASPAGLDVNADRLDLYDADHALFVVRELAAAMRENRLLKLPPVNVAQVMRVGLAAMYENLRACAEGALDDARVANGRLNAYHFS